MEESILIHIKKLLGISETDTNFDVDVITHINSVFFRLYELGLTTGTSFFTISDDTAVWNDYTENSALLSVIPTYIYEKVKLVFDPPLSSSVIDAMYRHIAELEWLIADIIERS